MSNLLKSDRLGKSNIQPHDPQFDRAMQVQLIVPRQVFERQGLEVTPEIVRKLVNQVLLKMPRFEGFRLGSHILVKEDGDARIVLERKNLDLFQHNSVFTLVLPEEFVLPPVMLGKILQSKSML
jgi:hypothetical protein